LLVEAAHVLGSFGRVVDNEPQLTIGLAVVWVTFQGTSFHVRDTPVETQCLVS
jgi:hypothetical protein